MSGINDPQYLLDLEARYAEYYKAEITILNGGQEYTIKDRTLERGDLKFIATELTRLANEIAMVKAGNQVRVKKVVVRYDT